MKAATSAPMSPAPSPTSTAKEAPGVVVIVEAGMAAADITGDVVDAGAIAADVAAARVAAVVAAAAIGNR